MARTLFAMTIAQMLVPMVALTIWKPAIEETPGIMAVVMLNAFFALLFAGSGLLFRRASIRDAK